ncbi:Mu transposase C-terminal domain-containing protein [Rhizobium sp. PRIMUS64]|uniref:Mu transposase C-terminal domain-containing protein n=1 Tax=Rhizobium sp. PRIMUS64 TaxID=2908925 RepID=UPI001FF3234E|nr:Mu transposase C-terminal domain-containing protein [Rhizobium sp. PRIMUS64]MCJ9691352.1 Mu transposase C-terminal domain-containing protein [Rhizobium sp. PRIMUS64]
MDYVHGYEPSKYHFSRNDGFERLSIQYRWHSSDSAGHRLERTDNNLVEFFTHRQISEMLEDRNLPLIFKRNRYGGDDAVVAEGVRKFAEQLSDEEQETTLFKEDFCKRFLKKEKEDRNVSRSDAKMEKTIADIVEDIKEDAKKVKPSPAEGERTKKKDYRKQKKEDLQEAAESIVFIPSPRSLRRWLAKYEVTQDRMAFVSKNGRCRVGTYYSVEEEAILMKHVMSYASEDKPNMIDCWDAMVKEIEAANKEREALGIACKLRLPSLKTLQKRIGQLPQALKDRARLGQDAATALYRPVHEGVEALRPLERVEFDEWKVDLQTLLVLSGVTKGWTQKQLRGIPRMRMVLTAAIDVATRCLIAFRVHREAPSVSTAIATLELTTFDKTEFAKAFGCITPWYMHGHIEQLVFDSATWFTAQAFRVTLSDLGTGVFFPPTGAASARGTIERFFKTASTKAFRYFSGRTWGSPDELGGTDAQANASVTYDETTKILYRFFVDVYHNEPHDGLGDESPREAWDRLARMYRVGPPVFGDERRHIFGINVHRKVHKTGVTFMGVTYQSPTLQQFRRGKRKPEVLIRVSRHDLGKISIWLKRGWVSVPAVFHEEFSGMSLYAWSATCNALRSEAKEKKRLSREVVRQTKAYLMENAALARLEVGLGSPCLNEEDFLKWEKKIDFRLGTHGPGEAVSEDFAKNLDLPMQFFLDMGFTASTEAANYLEDPRYSNKRAEEPRAPSKNPEDTTRPASMVAPISHARGTKTATKFDN